MMAVASVVGRCEVREVGNRVESRAAWSLEDGLVDDDVATGKALGKFWGLDDQVDKGIADDMKFSRLHLALEEVDNLIERGAES